MPTFCLCPHNFICCFENEKNIFQKATCEIWKAFDSWILGENKIWTATPAQKSVMIVLKFAVWGLLIFCRNIHLSYRDNLLPLAPPVKPTYAQSDHLVRIFRPQAFEGYRPETELLNRSNAVWLANFSTHFNHMTIFIILY